jgi:hypothetical protein
MRRKTNYFKPFLRFWQPGLARFGACSRRKFVENMVQIVRLDSAVLARSTGKHAARVQALILGA